MIFDIHIFVCTNQRSGSDKLSCGETHGLEVLSELKKQVKDLNVNLKIRANKSGCLGICDLGQTIAIYPDGTFYVGVQKDDIKEIIESHIVNKIPVERLILKSWKN